MRENKFRIWERKGKRWLPPQSMVICGLENGVFDVNAIFKNKNYILQEFTGLTDVNNQDIYEGDIVEQFDEAFKGMFTGVVRYDITNAAFVLWQNSGVCSHLDLDTIRKKLGNILENPELAP